MEQNKNGDNQPLSPLPKQQYINYYDVKNLIGVDKVKVNEDDTSDDNGIPISLANELVANGVTLVVFDLSPFYVTDPELIAYNPKTNISGDWKMLLDFAPQTYNILRKCFTYMGAYEIISSFVTINTKYRDHELLQFADYYQHQYKQIFTRIVEKLSTGNYKYNLYGLKPLLENGISREVSEYGMTGSFGGDDYSENQLTNPQQNWLNGFYNNGNY